MTVVKTLLLSGLGVIAGGLIAIQSVLNASLGQRIGNFGSVLVLTIVSLATLIALILVFPSTSDLRDLPGLPDWYLYAGGVLGVVILAAPIYLVPRIGAAATLVAIVLGQLLLAVAIDHFGLFASPKIEIGLARGIGVGLVVIGAVLVNR